MKKYLFLILALLMSFSFSTIAFSKQHKRETKVIGSIQISKHASLEKKVALAKINISQAISSGLQSNHGKCIDAELSTEDGSLVYTLIILQNKEKKEVFVDAGTGKVLVIQKDEDDKDSDE